MATEIKPLKNYWIVIDNKGRPRGYSLSGQKKESIRAYLTWTTAPWKDFLKQGFRCIKVEAEFKTI